MRKNIFFTILLFSITQTSYAQTAQNSVLFNELKSRDSLIFDRGFNACDFSSFGSIISDDFEFYHDKNGVMENKEAFLQVLQLGVCSDPDRKPIRKLVGATVKVYPLYQKGLLYGAIQTGEHEFYIKEKGKEMYKTGIALFTHLWIKTKDGWQLKRVLSYDHKAPND